MGEEVGVNGGQQPAGKTAVVLDQHPLWLEAIQALLEQVDVRVTGRATDVDQAVALVADEQPDLLITEIDAPAGTSEVLSKLQQACRLHPHTKWIVLSSDDNPTHIDEALGAGAALYCLKTVPPDDLASAIRHVFDRSIYFAGPRSQLIAPADTTPIEEQMELTRREVEILRLVAEGSSNAQLAQMLWVTEQTVKFHLSNIYRKLGVGNRTEASRWAQLNGLLPESQQEAVSQDERSAPSSG